MPEGRADCGTVELVVITCSPRELSSLRQTEQLRCVKYACHVWKPARRAALPSPNIWYYPDVYELENRAQDVAGEIWRVLAAECDWSGRDVLDVGCGDGFHLPRFAETAKSVLGVEPHEPLV